MEAFIMLGVVFGLMYVLFILPQQRRVRAHQQLVASLEEGDEVVLTAGIYGRIARLGPEELDLQVAPGVELQVARQAVLRKVEHAVDEGMREAIDDREVEAGNAQVDSGPRDDNNADLQRGDDLAFGSSDDD